MIAGLLRLAGVAVVLVAVGFGVYGFGWVLGWAIDRVFGAAS